MELNQLWRVFLRRWWLILLPVVIAAIVAVPALLTSGQSAAGGWQTRWQYSAAQQNSNLPQREGDYQDVWLASEFVVNAFTDWLVSSSFRRELIAEVGDEALLNGLNIVADNNRSIGTVFMSHPDQTALARLADASIIVLQTRNHDYFPHLGNEPAEVMLLDAPVVTPAPQPILDLFTPIFQLGAALFAGLVLAVLAEWFDPTLRYHDEVEAAGLTVLANIPRQ